MKEIIVLGIGSAGINLSSSYLSLLTQEHDFSFDSTQSLSVHFQETCSNSPMARFIFIDLDPTHLDNLLSHPTGFLFNQNNIIAGNEGSMNIYTCAAYELTDYIFDTIKESFRKEIEKCESLQGILLNNSIIGGTGSGLTSRIEGYLCDEYSKSLLINNAIVPTLNEDHGFCEVQVPSIYNAMLSVNSMIEFPNLCINTDNQALINRAEKDTFYNENSWDSINKPLIQSISALTSGSRFCGLQAASLLKIMNNSVIYPRRHFFASDYYYYEKFSDNYDFVTSCKKNIYMNKKESMFTYKNIESNQTTLSFFALLRGYDIFSSEIEEFNINPLKNHLFNGFVGHVDKTSNYFKEAGVFTEGKFIGYYMKKLSELFRKSYRKKGFVHWFTGYGMDSMEFESAESNVNDLVSEYTSDDYSDIIEDDEEEEGNFNT